MSYSRAEAKTKDCHRTTGTAECTRPVRRHRDAVFKCEQGWDQNHCLEKRLSGLFNWNWGWRDTLSDASTSPMAVPLGRDFSSAWICCSVGFGPRFSMGRSRLLWRIKVAQTGAARSEWKPSKDQG